MLNRDPLTYRIQPAPGGWAWRTVDGAGRTVEKGVAQSRAVAAACIIRSIARSLEPEAKAKAA